MSTCYLTLWRRHVVLPWHAQAGCWPVLCSFWLLLALATPARAEAPLADLIEAGDSRGALALLAAGAEVNAAQPDGSTALLWAVYQVDEALVAALLQREADPALGNRFGATPLLEAAKLGHAGLIGQLLQAGAAPDSADADGQTPLMLVAGTGSLA
ncbi:MAG: ankyrin repeat domain-containing protein, partial [Pseudohongiellaceae bacterium]